MRRRTRVSDPGSDVAVSLHHWFSFTLAMDAFSLLSANTFLRYGLYFCFKPVSLPVFCCWISSSSKSMLVLLPVFLVRSFGGVLM